MKTKFILALFLILLLSACGADPRREAAAFKTRTEAEQSALNQGLKRAQAEQLNTIQHALQVAETNNQIAIAAEWTASMRKLIGYAWLPISIMVMVGAFAFSNATLKIADAAARKANVNANLIYLDPVTRQYPVLLQYIGKGRYSLTDINAKATLMLDTRNPGDAQSIAGAIAVQHAGVLAMEARRSQDSGRSIAGIQPTIIQPTIIDATDIANLFVPQEMSDADV